MTAAAATTRTELLIALVTDELRRRAVLIDNDDDLESMQLEVGFAGRGRLPKRIRYRSQSSVNDVGGGGGN